DPFFTTKPLGKGLGLGLSISYGIVQDFGGQIHAVNRPEGGAELTVELPRHQHAAFGHPPHPFRQFMDKGTNVALGTDSLASNPDLDMLAEMRFLHERHPEF